MLSALATITEEASRKIYNKRKEAIFKELIKKNQKSEEQVKRSWRENKKTIIARKRKRSLRADDIFLNKYRYMCILFCSGHWKKNHNTNKEFLSWNISFHSVKCAEGKRIWSPSGIIDFGINILSQFYKKLGCVKYRHKYDLLNVGDKRLFIFLTYTKPFFFNISY